MRTIGIIGGMSAESTALYCRRLNEEARRRLGGLHSAEILVWSVDFAPIAEMQAAGAWTAAGARLADIARRLEGAGADMILLATNTMHKLADAIEAAITVPFLHIADQTAERIRAAGLKRPGLMATRYTMEEAFYKGRLADRHGLAPIVPDAEDRASTHRIIYEELCRGIVQAQSRASYEAIAARLVAKGADCLILGCTEVGMLLGPANVAVPVFDTTLIHADAALDLALAEAAPRPGRVAQPTLLGATGTDG
ncbi:MAG: aspartate/glutamate racemase family protein [Hyphomicrobiaceae bacterium]